MIKDQSDTVAYLEFDDNRLLPLLYGEHDKYLMRIEEALEISIVARGNQLVITGSEVGVAAAKTILEKLYSRLQSGNVISSSEVEATIRLALAPATSAQRPREKKTYKELEISTRRRVVRPRSAGQEVYLDTLQKYNMVFAVGPAGTGKTYLAVATGVSMLLKGQVDRIILSRPAVEAGEKLGFLPGDLREKVDPYLRPLYDALHDMMPGDQVIARLTAGDIEVAPLAFMRGRTLSNSYIILDEAQNTTSAQMKMFLTRLGEGSYMVVSGDMTQIDLPQGQLSGLKDAVKVLNGIKDIGFVYLDERDVVRHPLVSQIVSAYDKKDATKT